VKAASPLLNRCTARPENTRQELLAQEVARGAMWIRTNFLELERLVFIFLLKWLALIS